MDEAGRGVDAEERVQAVAQRQRRSPPRAGRERIHPAAPHEVELDQRAVLVEDQQVDPIEEIVRPGAQPTCERAPQASAMSASTDSTGAFASRTSGPSIGKLTVDRVAELRAA